MNHYRVRRDGIEFPVAGTEALLHLVHEGSLSPNDRVFDPATSVWCPAGAMDALSAAFAARDSAAEARRNARPRPRTLTLPGTPAAPVAPGVPGAPPGEPSPPPDDPPRFEIPPDLLPAKAGDPEPDPAGPPAAPADSPPAGGGRVLAFPGTKPLAGLAGAMDPARARAALQDPASFLRQSRPPALPRTVGTHVRPALLVMTVTVAVIGALLVVSWVQHDASQRFARASGVEFDEVAPPTEGTEPAAPPRQVNPDAEASAFYDEMELSLRNRMVSGCTTIAREDDLDTALRIELSRLGVQVQTVHAPVLTWGGRHGDVPLAVDIKIWYESRQEQLDRELGAIGLVVGKYAQNYSLDVRSFELFLRHPDGSTRKRSLDEGAARQFYLRRISLLEFLKSEAG